MPAGVSNPVIGYLGFCAVKFAGYSLAARFISRSYQRTDRSAFLIGGVRTLIGIAAGAAYYNIWRLIPDAAAAGRLASRQFCHTLSTCQHSSDFLLPEEYGFVETDIAV